ncbi:MAG TPA: hypothetical protein PKD94_15010, partial [Ignavibacteria bacterium]|nr:hypothetical protein [Ignavibacteria bacterium]
DAFCALYRWALPIDNLSRPVGAFYIYSYTYFARPRRALLPLSGRRTARGMWEIERGFFSIFAVIINHIRAKALFLFYPIHGLKTVANHT